MLVITLSIIKMSLQVCNSPSWSNRVGKAKPHFPTFQRYSGSYRVLLLEDSLTVCWEVPLTALMKTIWP